MSFIVEALSSALGVPRADVSSALDAIESRLSAVRGDLQRRAGAALGRGQSSEESADELVAVAASLDDPGMKRLVAKLLLSIGGVAWGISVGGAALNAGAGAVVAIGAGLALEPVIALLLAIAILYISGHCALAVLRELWSRLNRQIDSLADA